MEITRGIIRKPLRVVVYGPEGIGKTTFASQFPAPLFIDTENSTEFMDVARLPKPESWTMLLREIEEAKKLAGTYRTLVLDTADWAEALGKKEIISSKQISGIEDIGYGKGYVYLAEKWGDMLNKLTEVRDAGMNIVITAHAAMRKFEQPDEMGAYDRWELKLEKKTAPLLKEWADMLLFANYETFVVKEAGKEKSNKGKAQGGRRVMYTAHHSCWDAKNRQGLPDKLPFAFDQIAHCLPENNGTILRQTGREMPGLPENNGTILRQTGREMPGLPDSADAPEMPKIEPSRSAEPVKQETVPEEKREQEAPAEAAREQESPESGLPFTMEQEPEADAVPPKLRQLMDDADVLEDEVRKVISGKGYYPKDAPWFVMQADGFVDGWVLPFWNKIVEMIRSNPNRIPF